MVLVTLIGTEGFVNMVEFHNLKHKLIIVRPQLKTQKHWTFVSSYDWTPQHCASSPGCEFIYAHY